MRKFLLIFLSAVIISPALADLSLNKTNNNPEGVFRKKRNGEIVQYDKNGRKIGVYKVIQGRFIKIK